MTDPTSPFAATDVPPALMRQTLVDRDLVRPTTAQPVIRLLPSLKVVTIGGLVLQLMGGAKHGKEIQIVNGLVPGNVTKALAGEHVGTIVHAG